MSTSDLGDFKPTVISVGLKNFTKHHHDDTRRLHGLTPNNYSVRGDLVPSLPSFIHSHFVVRDSIPSISVLYTTILARNEAIGVVSIASRRPIPHLTEPRGNRHRRHHRDPL